MLQSKRVRRVYLDEIAVSQNPPVGLEIVRLLFASVSRAQEIAPRVVQQDHTQFAGSDLESKVIELVEGLLSSRFPQFDRQELRMKFKLHGIRESKVWKEAHDEGIEEGKTIARREMVRNLRANGMTDKQIAAMLKIPVDEIQRLSKNHFH